MFKLIDKKIFIILCGNFVLYTLTYGSALKVLHLLEDVYLVLWNIIADKIIS